MGIYGKAIFVKMRYINTLTFSLYPIYIHKVFPVTPQHPRRSTSTGVLNILRGCRALLYTL